MLHIIETQKKYNRYKGNIRYSDHKISYNDLLLHTHMKICNLVLMLKLNQQMGMSANTRISMKHLVQGKYWSQQYKGLKTPRTKQIM